MNFSQFPENILYGRNDLFIVFCIFLSSKMCNIMWTIWDMLYCYVLLHSEWLNWSLRRQMQQGCYTDAWVPKRFKLKHNSFSDLLYSLKYLRQQLDTYKSIRDFQQMQLFLQWDTVPKICDSFFIRWRYVLFQYMCTFYWSRYQLIELVLERLPGICKYIYCGCTNFGLLYRLQR